ncbi:Endoribonuclease YSH1 [Yarrowia sp. C11]|nr:Endoribonuclease YSH1 [Yarrowia sp. C11]KAG5364919.1 Endoribonuclease YSH1 [Yarrowia sp. E02]
MAEKRESQDDDSDTFSFVALGGGREVGRSCHVISFKGKTIMLDAGVHPAHSGLASLPFYDEFDLSTIDILLISHFHLDHAASLPYVMQKTNFKGRVFMTHPTKGIYRWLLSDFVRVTSGAESDPDLYSEADLTASFNKIETIDYHSTMEVNGVKFTAYHAGHVLGAAMYTIEVGGVKVLFTGDYSREEDRHLNQAEVPPMKPDILICESTYGTGTHLPRLEREQRLTGLIHSTLDKGGKCLLPVFALGRAQEILLILDEYWEAHPDLQEFSIYYASALAKKCIAVYQTYINMMNDNIRRRFRDQKSNPFRFKYIKNIKNLDRFDDMGPCVMVASPGMLQSGVSRSLLERWAPDPKNTLILTGYSVEGTMAKQIINEPNEIPSAQNPDLKIPRRLAVEELSFAAHVDFQQNSEFIDLVDSKNIILVHGELNNMQRLKAALLAKYRGLKNSPREKTIYNPRNCEEVELAFKGVKVAKTVGKMAEEKPHVGQIISGVVVQKDFNYGIMGVADLREHAGLSTSSVLERQTVTVNAGVDLVKYHLEQMFGYVEMKETENVKIEEMEEDVAEEEDDKEVKKEVEDIVMEGQVQDVTVEEVKKEEEVKEEFKKEVEGEEGSAGTTFVVMNSVTVKHTPTSCTIEWVGSCLNDSIADAVLAILLTVDNSRASVKMSSKQCSHGHDHGNGHSEDGHSNSSLDERVLQLSSILKAQFGDSYVVSEDGKSANIKIDAMEATISFSDLSVTGSPPPLVQRVQVAVDRAISLVAPLAQKLSAVELVEGFKAIEGGQKAIEGVKQEEAQIEEVKEEPKTEVKEE